MALTPRLTTYSFDQVSLLLGPIIMDGFQEGEGFSMETEDSFGKITGADGKTTRYKMLNRTARITVKLMQSSATNDQLSALWNLARKSKNGEDILPLFCRDNSGRAVFSAAEAWIAAAPKNISFGTEATGREWIIDVAVLERFDGGN